MENCQGVDLRVENQIGTQALEIKEKPVMKEVADNGGESSNRFVKVMRGWVESAQGRGEIAEGIYLNMAFCKIGRRHWTID